VRAQFSELQLAFLLEVAKKRHLFRAFSREKTFKEGIIVLIVVKI
jgi:hypothetical protein